MPTNTWNTPKIESALAERHTDETVRLRLGRRSNPAARPAGSAFMNPARVPVRRQPAPKLVQTMAKAPANPREGAWRCVSGHDRCSTSYAGPDCPYCERIPIEQLVRRPSTSRGWAETALQRAIGRLLDIYENQGRLLWWPVPNGSFIAGNDAAERAKRVAKMKADCMLRPGVPDLGILFPHNRVIFAELKAGKNDLTPAQLAFREKVMAMGGWFYVWRDVDAAQVDLRRWM